MGHPTFGGLVFVYIDYSLSLTHTYIYIYIYIYLRYNIYRHTHTNKYIYSLYINGAKTLTYSCHCSYNTGLVIRVMDVVLCVLKARATTRP